eukprot:gene19000-biopygen12992
MVRSYGYFACTLGQKRSKRSGPPLAWARTPGSLGPGAWGAGTATLVCQKIAKTISLDTGNRKNARRIWRCPCSSFSIEDFVPAIRSLKPPLVERIPVVHLWASPGAWGDHAGLPKITKISHQTRIIGESGKSYLARLHSDLSNAAKI